MKTSEKHVSIAVIIMFFLLIAIIVGIIVIKYNDDSFFTYNGFDFTKVPIGYQTKLYVNDASFPNSITLRSDPRDLEDIDIDFDVSSLLDKKEIFITIDPYANLTGVTTIAVLEIDRIIDNPFLYDIPVNASFVKPYEDGGLSVITCSDATDTVEVIWMRLEDENKIYSSNGCVIVAGVTEDDLIRAADKIVYSLLGVLK